MQVFISWSGEKSRDVAEALRQWLPHVLQEVDPFVSSRDLSAGTRWAVEIAEKLKDTGFGLVCVTRENQHEPWLNFEAGAIAKQLDVSRVVPLAIDLQPAEISHPLGQFQAAKVTNDGMREVIKSLNDSCPSPLPQENLTAALEKWWPDLELNLQKISEKSYDDGGHQSLPDRSDRAMLEEVLETVRGLSRAAIQRPIEDSFSGDLRTVLVNAGATSWTLAQRSGHEYDLAVDLPITPQLQADLNFIGSLHGVKFNLGQRTRVEPAAKSD